MLALSVRRVDVLVVSDLAGTAGQLALGQAAPEWDVTAMRQTIYDHLAELPCGLGPEPPLGQSRLCLWPMPLFARSHLAVATLD